MTKNAKRRAAHFIKIREKRPKNPAKSLLSSEILKLQSKRDESGGFFERWQIVQLSARLREYSRLGEGESCLLKFINIRIDRWGDGRNSDSQ